MAVADLTGTTWVINENPDVDSSHGDYYITFLDGMEEEWDIFSYGWGPMIEYINSYLEHSEFVYQESEGWAEVGYRTISITAGDDVTNAALIAWLEANAVQQGVIRNDYFTCTDELKSVADAIRTKGGTSASLTYPNGFVTAINNLPTKILGAGTITGYNSPFDIQVTAEDYSGGNWDGFSSVTININTPFYDGSCDIIDPLITFTIDNTTYQAEDGMTWVEWAGSEYNTDNYYIEGNLITYSYGTGSLITPQNILYNSSTQVLKSDLIISQYQYIKGLITGGGGNGGADR